MRISAFCLWCLLIPSMVNAQEAIRFNRVPVSIEINNRVLQGQLVELSPQQVTYRNRARVIKLKAKTVQSLRTSDGKVSYTKGNESWENFLSRVQFDRLQVNERPNPATIIEPKNPFTAPARNPAPATIFNDGPAANENTPPAAKPSVIISEPANKVARPPVVVGGPPPPVNPFGVQPTENMAGNSTTRAVITMPPEENTGGDETYGDYGANKTLSQARTVRLIVKLVVFALGLLGLFGGFTWLRR